MRDVIPLTSLIKEISKILHLERNKPTIHTTVFEDNNGAIELAKEPKYRPRTKHIAIKYHHFRSHVEKGDVSVKAIDSKEQLADIFTKALPRPQFE